MAVNAAKPVFLIIFIPLLFNQFGPIEINNKKKLFKGDLAKTGQQQNYKVQTEIQRETRYNL